MVLSSLLFPPSITDLGRSFLAVMALLLVWGVLRGDGSDFWLVMSLPAVVMDSVSCWLTSRLSDMDVDL